MAVALTTDVKIADLTALSNLTELSEGIQEGSFRLVESTAQGSAWYRYALGSSLAADGITIVSGEAGRWIRLGDRINFDVAAPVNAPAILSSFFFDLTGKQLYLATGLSSVDDWQPIGSSGAMKTINFSTPPISDDALYDVDFTISKTPFILASVATDSPARVNIFTSINARTALREDAFGLNGLSDINKDGVQFDYQDDSSPINWNGSVVCHGLVDNSTSIPITITNKSGASQAISVTLKYYLL